LGKLRLEDRVDGMKNPVAGNHVEKNNKRASFLRFHLKEKGQLDLTQKYTAGKVGGNSPGEKRKEICQAHNLFTRW